MTNKISVLITNPFNLFVFLISILLSQQSYSQEDLKMEALNRYQLKRSDTLYEFYAVKPNHKIKYDNTKNYFWYLQDTIIITQAANDGKILHGSYTIYYPDKNLKEKGEFKNGLKNGVWKYWYSGGKLKQIITWNEGNIEGKVEEYNEYGNRIKVGTYKNDLFTGYIMEGSTDDKSVKIFYKNGKKAETGSTKQ